MTPAIAVIEEIKRRKLPWRLMFIGRNHAFEGGTSPAHEKRLVEALGVSFHALFTGRLQRTWSAFTFLSLLKVPVGLLQVLFLLMRDRPTVTLSLGGYIAFPVVIASWVLGIPVVTHEQTVDLGLSNRIIARIARRVLVARDVGVPIRQSLFEPPEKPSFPIDTKHALIYITGGSTGAQTLNALVFPIVSKLIGSHTVIHQVGTGDISNARMVKESLPEDMHGRYIVAPYFDGSDVAWIYRHASLLIGRSGANTVAEAAALCIPALFVPLPWAAGDEQTKNATTLVEDGMAMILTQKSLTPQIFLTHISQMMAEIKRYTSMALAKAKHYPRHAAGAVVDAVGSIVS